MIVRDVVDKILEESASPSIDPTCDQLMAGSLDAEVTGIVSTFMATVEVIKGALAKGANLIITHEPTYFTGADQTDWLEGDEVYLQKKKLIEDTKVNIWRFHDHMHMSKPQDKIYTGLNHKLGWSEFVVPEARHCYQIPKTTVGDLSDFFCSKLDVKAVRLVGDKAMSVERVGILVGGGSLGLGSEQMPMELMRAQNLDVVVCGEILEWTLCAYVRDAYQLGLNKSMIVLGHNRTEEVGMEYLTTWLSSLFPDVPVDFVEAGEPFTV